MTDAYYVCASAGHLHVALDGAYVASVDAANDPDGDVPTLRLAEHLGVTESAGENPRFLAVEHDRRRVHLLVRDGVRVRQFPSEAAHPLPAWVAALEQRIGVSGVLLEDPELFLVLDPAVLVRAALPEA